MQPERATHVGIESKADAFGCAKQTDVARATDRNLIGGRETYAKFVRNHGKSMVRESDGQCKTDAGHVHNRQVAH